MSAVYADLPCPTCSVESCFEDFKTVTCPACGREFDFDTVYRATFPVTTEAV